MKSARLSAKLMRSLNMVSKICDYCHEAKDHVYEHIEVASEPHILFNISADGKRVESVIKNTFMCEECFYNVHTSS